MHNARGQVDTFGRRTFTIGRGMRRVGSRGEDGMSDQSSAGKTPARWFVRGDIDGFFGLALDNLIQVLVILTLCTYVLGFSPEITYGRMLPGIAVSLVVGNLFYAWQAKKLADRTGRSDVCALPYGINTVSLFAFVILVMIPVKIGAERNGIPTAAPASSQPSAPESSKAEAPGPSPGCVAGPRGPPCYRRLRASRSRSSRRASCSEPLRPPSSRSFPWAQ